jgi:hypothetical protein
MNIKISSFLENLASLLKNKNKNKNTKYNIMLPKKIKNIKQKYKLTTPTNYLIRYLLPRKP